MPTRLDSLTPVPDSHNWRHSWHMTASCSRKTTHPKEHYQIL
ncbi:hypothetical protein [Veillonella sp.]|nr:hypothetical protein [Veillonella sp.]